MLGSNSPPEGVTRGEKGGQIVTNNAQEGERRSAVDCGLR
jgi:hypothetical protein